MTSTNPFDDDYEAPSYKCELCGTVNPDSHRNSLCPNATPGKGRIIYHHNLVQGTDEWFAARLGMITSSVVKNLVTTKTLKVSTAETAKKHMWELLAQRITGNVDPSFDGWNVQRGHEEEVQACIEYGRHFAPVDACGFITNDQWGFPLGYSPDGLVGDDGLVECKSRIQKYQAQLVVEHLPNGTIPDEFVLQVQTGLLVTGRKWCDFLSRSNGWSLVRIRVYPDPAVQAAILVAAKTIEAQLQAWQIAYANIAEATGGVDIFPAERITFEYERDDEIIASGD
jgi:hypothetical protein